MKKSDTFSESVKSNGEGSSCGQRERVVYFDLLNLFACLCVVYLHANTMVHTFAPGRNWVLALVIECLGYCAVPIFFMLTGATLMRYRDRYSTREFAIKRIKRTVVPFLFWSLVWYILLNVIRAGEPFDLGACISKIISNGIVGVYWFFFPLFAVYLSLPALSLLVDNRRVLWYLAIASFILESLLPQVFSMLHLGWNSELKVSLASGYLMLVIIGYLMSTEELDKRRRTWIYIVGICSLVFKFIYTLVLSEATWTYDKTLAGYMGFVSVAQSVAVFVWFKYHDWSSIAKRSRLVARLASCSFGVYLIHWPIILVVVFGWMGVPMTSILFRLVGAFVCYVAIVALVMLLKRTPLVKEIMP